MYTNKNIIYVVHLKFAVFATLRAQGALVW